MLLRSAKLEDAAAIARLHVASWRVAYRNELPAEYLASLDESARAERWRTALAQPATRMVLAERDGALLGFCAHGPGASLANESLTSAWEIYALHVKAELRGSGIGTALFTEGARVGREMKASALILWVVISNVPARRFYEAKGMQLDGGEKTRELAPGVVLHEVRYRSELG